MIVILVSGTPGTGKTTYARKLAKDKKYRYLDVNALIDEKKLIDGYDKKRDSKIIDTEKLNAALIELISSEKKAKGMVIDSHLSHFLPPKYASKCIITKCSLPVLKKRLEERKYSKAKVRENLDAEIFDTCRVEALELGHNVEVVLTD
ncbi:MAG: AAA family ATPase [Nanoarchaeota archaeon]|nr:AAA family ATPase [Nanoarchaeota archaeon]